MRARMGRRFAVLGLCDFCVIFVFFCLSFVFLWSLRRR